MKMKNRKTTLLVVVAVVLVVLGAALLRAVPRWLAMQKILSSSECVSRLAVIPEPKIEVVRPANLDLALVNIGYAKFCFPAQQETRMTARGRGDAVILESEVLVLGFNPPHNYSVCPDLMTSALIKAIERLKNVDAVSHNLLDDSSYQPKALNIVDLRLLTSEVRPLPFYEIFMMSHEEYNSYMLKLITKATFSPRAERIIPYETAYSTGVIHIYEGGKRGIVEMTTHDRSISQAVTFSINEPHSLFPSESLCAFIATYQFTVPSCDWQDKIAEMIAATGIIPWTPLEEDPVEREEIDKNLQQNQMELIRKGAKTLPIPLTQDMDDQLVKEVVIPPRDD